MNACWEDCLKIVYGEAESVDSGETVCGFNITSDARKYPPASEGERQEAYRVILTHNMERVEPDCRLYHYVSMPHFVKAIKASAFFLARPYTWSKSDDPAFNVAIKTGVLDGKVLSAWQKKFLEAYMRNTFGMCWSRKSSNKSLLAKKIKDGSGAPVVEIQSTATRLLSAYLTKTDPLAPAKFFLVDMQYVTPSTLHRTSFAPEDLELVNYAFQRHREMLSLMAREYKAQDEVRLIVERDDLRDEQIVDNKFFAKRVDLGSVFTGLKLHGFNRAVAEKDFIDSYARTLNLNFEIVS